MGNTIREYFPWRYIFGAVGLIGVASFLITWFLLKETNKNRGITGGFSVKTLCRFKQKRNGLGNIRVFATGQLVFVYNNTKQSVGQPFAFVANGVFGVFGCGRAALCFLPQSSADCRKVKSVVKGDFK